MALYFAFLSFSFITSVCIAVSESPDDATYEGCFKEDPSRREFVVSGGNYDFNDINPKLCKALCKSMDFQYAALQRGHMCLCGATAGTHSNGSQYGCNLRCSGSPTDLCGGFDYSSVYSTTTAVKSLTVVDPGYIEVLQQTVIGTTLAAGSDTALYSFDYGDATSTADLTPGPQPHVFSDVGVYLVKVGVANNDSGPIEARREVYIEAPISDLRTVCHPFVEVGFAFECIGSVGQGNNMDVGWDFNDDTEEVHMQVGDAQRFSVGLRVPRRLGSVQSPLNLQGVYLMPAAEFTEEGKLEAWEVFAVKEGRVKLQVYRPLCREDLKYCPFNRTCISKYFPCPPFTETPCGNHTTFCLEAGTCQPFQTTYYFAESNATFTLAPCWNQTLTAGNASQAATNGTGVPDDNPVQMCNYSVPDVRVPEYAFGLCTLKDAQREMNLPYSVIGETVVYLKQGYNVFTVNSSDRFTVRPHDWVGCGPYQQKFPSYYRKAAYPLVGEIAHFQTNNESVFFKEQGLLSPDTEVEKDDTARLDIRFYVRAHVSKPTTSWVSHSFSSSGMFEINARYNNLLGKEAVAPPQRIASQYRILSIQGLHFTRELGIYYACTDEAYPMHVEITQGTFVRFTWTFPDGSLKTSLPFLTNGIQDGPAAKTTDTMSYLFSEIGNYTTYVKAYNNVSFVDITLSVISRYRITGLNGSVVLKPGDNTTKDWNLILSGCWFEYSSFITGGNVVQYQWDHGDGTTWGGWTFNTTHDHFYSEPGVYSVLVEADNIASTLDDVFEVTAVKPNHIQAPEYTTSLLPTLFICEVTWHTGEGLTFNWDFGDGASAVVENSGLARHNYSTFNTYQVQCVIGNYPAVSDTKPIIVQDPVEGVSLHNKTQVLATGDTIDFTVTWSKGNDVHFDWYFGDNGTDSTTASTVEYVYNRIGYYNVTVNVSNVVSWMMSNAVVVELQERITNVQVAAGDDLIRHPVQASVSIDTGNKVWFDYDFGDSFNATYIPQTTYVHSYGLPDTYTVTVRAYNNVSVQIATTSIQVDASITGAVLYLASPHVRADVLEARCVASNGSSVAMTFDWGDGVVSGPFDGIYDGQGSFFVGTHTYTAEGTYNITCYVENPWADAAGFYEVVIQETIVALYFEPVVCVKGNIFEFVVLPFVGDGRDVLFFWSYDDGIQFTTDAFTHQYVYRDAGLYEVTVRAQNLVSEFSTTQDLYVQEHVEGLRIQADVVPVVPTRPTFITWEITYGTEVMYTVNMGDGTEPHIFEQVDVGKMWYIEYVYTEPGTYQITIIASNKLNALNVSTLAHVEYAIEGLRAYIRGNKTTHTDQSAYIIIEIERGTNVEYTCDYHDGSLPIVTRKRYCKHMFIDLGHRLVTVQATNHLSSDYVQANDTYYVLLPPIPHEIKGLAIGAPSAVVRGAMTVFRLERHRGNRFNCTWSFGDNTTLLDLDQYFVYLPINHTYELIGEYEMQLNCTNFFYPPVFASAKVVVQVPPSGLTLTSQKIGQYGIDLPVNISLSTGTDVQSDMSFNNGVYSLLMEGLAGYAVIPGERVNVSGWLDVTIRARNLVPPVLILQDRIYVEAEISGMSVWAEKPYVGVGEVVNLHASLATGTNVILEWHFGTNFVLTSSLNATSLSDTKQHLYPSLGLYATFVVAHNEISTRTHLPILIAVQNKVRGFSLETDSPVRYPDGIITFSLLWDTRLQKLPTNASITVDFGQGVDPPLVMELESLEMINWIQHNLTTGSNCDLAEEQAVNPLCYTNFTQVYMVGARVRIFTIAHAYSPGTYSTVVSVHNLVNEEVFRKSVQTEVPVVNCSIVALNIKRPGVEFGAEGGGPEQNYFPLEYPVHFVPRVGQGTGVRFIWQFGDGAVTSGYHAYVEHRYVDAGSYSLRLVALNVFSMEDSFKIIHTQESVIGLFMAHSGPVASYEQITIVVFAAQPGTEAVYTLQINNETERYLIDTPSNDSIAIVAALEIMNPNIYLPFDPFTHSVATFNLTFNSSGDFEVTVTGANYAASQSITSILSVTEDPCRLPRILIHGGSKNVADPWRVRRHQVVTLVSEVTLDCPQTTRALFHWEAYVVSYFHNEPLPANQLFGYRLPASIKTDEADLVIPRRVLDYNTYLMQLTVTMENEARVLNQNQTYLEVIPSDLVISITGGSAVTISWNDSISLHASLSFDPDDPYVGDPPIHEIHGLVFTWYCRLPDELFSFEEEFVAQGPSASGCFGDGPDVPIAMETASYDMPLENLTQSSEYIFAVVGSKEGRVSRYFTQTVTVIQGEPPKLIIRCLRNCRPKVNPQKQLALTVECTNCANRTRDLAVTWNVIGLGDAGSPSGFEISRDTVTGGDSLYLVIKPAIFLQHLSVQFSVAVSVLHSQSSDAGYSKYDYVIGGVPTQGSCEVSPHEGTALTTQFVITCTGFDSEERPLHYEYLYSTGSEDTASVTGAETTSEMYTLLYYSPEGVTAPMTLPMGTASRDYVVDIHVEVTDSLGASVHEKLRAKVLPMDVSELTTELTALRLGNASTLDLYLEKGDIQSATKLINTIASVLNEDITEDDRESTDSDEWIQQKIELRSNLVEKLTQVSVLNLDATKQISAAITQAIHNPEEVTPHTQMLAADSYLEMVDILNEESREGTSVDVIEDASRFFYSGASNLLRAAAFQVHTFYDLLESQKDDWNRFWSAEEATFSNITYPESVAVTLTQSTDTDPSIPDINVIEESPWVPYPLRESRNVTKKVLSVIEEISTIILRSKVPGEPGTVIQAGPLLLTLRKEDLQDPSDRFYQAADGSWFYIPREAMKEITAIYGEGSVSVQVLSLSENPYSWHLSAYDIKTSVIGLGLKDDNGGELIVTDLSAKIEMLIPRGEHSAVQLDPMTASSAELLYVHFNVTETHSSIHIDIHPDDGGREVPLEGLLRYGFHPTLEEYDLRIRLPIPEGDLYSSVFNSTQNITTHPYTWFIPENRLYAVGAYYLAVRPLGASDATSRSGSDNGTEELPEEEIQVDVNVKIYTARCMYWSTVYEQWFTYGCEVGSLTTATFTHCLCDHLSSFGGSFIVPPNRQVFVEEEVPEIVDTTRTFVILYSVGGVLGIFLLALGCAFKADWRFSKRLYGDLECEKTSYIVTFFTGMDIDSGTTATVFYCMHGASGTCEPIQVANPHNTALKGSCVDSFFATTATDVGKVKGITVWHNGQGYSPQWHLSRVLVHNYVTGDRSYFLCNHILKSANEPVTFKAATPSQLAHHLHLFATTPSYHPLTKHLSVWNMVARPAVSQFTHAERVASFFTPVFISMVLVTLLQGFLQPNEEMSSSGDAATLSLDMANIMIGLEAGWMVLPVYYLLVFVFSNSKPRVSIKESDRVATTPSTAPVIDRKSRGRRLRKPIKTGSLEEIKVEIAERKKDSVQVLDALSTQGDADGDSDVRDVTSDLATSIGIPRVPSTSSWSSEEWSDPNESFEDPYNVNQNANLPWEEHLNEGDLPDKGTSQNSNPASESADGKPRPRPLKSIYRMSTGHSRWSLSRHTRKAGLKDPTSTACLEGSDQDHSEIGRVKDVRKFNNGSGNGRHGVESKNPNWNQNAQRNKDASIPGSSKQHSDKSPKRSTKGKKQRKHPQHLRHPTARGVNRGDAAALRQEGESLEEGGFLKCLNCCGCNNVFPWWASIIMWLVTWMLISGSATLTVLLTWNDNIGKALNLLVPVVIASVQNLLLLQPVLAFLNAVFQSLFLKPDCLTRSSILFEATSSSFQQKAASEVVTQMKTKSKNSHLIRGHQLRKIQTSTSPKAKMLKFIKKYVAAWLFLGLVTYIAHGKRNVTEFYMTSTTKNMFIKSADHLTPSFHEVHKADQFWQWTQETLLPGLAPVMHAERDYQHLKLLGTPLLRQLRVNKTIADACRDTVSHREVPLSSSIPCSSSYSPLTEDTSQYLNSWQQTDHISPSLQLEGYRFYTTEEIQGAAFAGRYASYHGGGYVAELSRGYSKAAQIIQNLEAGHWIDEYTRAIFVEFLLYNAQLNLTSVVRLAVEVLPTGYQEPVIDVGLVGVGEDSSLGGMIHLVCIGVLAVSVYSMMFTEAHCMLRWGRTYYTSLRHLIGLLNFLAAFFAVAILAYQWMLSGEASVTNPSLSVFVNTQVINSYTTILSATVVFTAIVKVLFQLQWSESMALLLQACEASFLNVLRSLPVFAATLMTFVFTGWTLYSGHIKSFHSLPLSAVAVVNFFIGGLPIETNEQRTLPVFLITLVSFVGFMVLLAFVVVILQTYKSSRFHNILSHFVRDGRLTKYISKLKSRFIVQKTHRKMEVRRYIVLRQSRYLRNRQPVFPPLLALEQIEKRMDRLLAQSVTDNEVLFGDPGALVNAVIRETTLLKALKQTGSFD